MMKINNKGFALVETLIVSVFVMSIFSLMYTNFFPMIGEYEKREKYDDIDSVYNTFLIKRMLEDVSAMTGYYNTAKNGVLTGGFYKIDDKCNYLFSSSDKKTYCRDLLKKLDVENVYLAQYNLTSMKNNKASLNNYMIDYLDSLPNYTKDSNGYTYRIVVQYKHTIDKESDKDAYIEYSFSTMGVDF